MREYPTTRENKEIEHIQQMFNLDDEQTVVQIPLMDTDVEVTITPIENGYCLNF